MGVKPHHFDTGARSGNYLDDRHVVVSIEKPDRRLSLGKGWIECEEITNCSYQSY